MTEATTTSTETPSKLKTNHAFAAGLLAALGAFSAFYLQHPEAVQHHYDENGTLGVILMLVAFALIALIAGLWTVANHPLTLKAALSFGLSVPGLLFATNLGGIGGGENAQLGPGALDGNAPVHAGIGAYALSDALLESLQFVTAPVTTVTRAARTQHPLGITRKQYDRLKAQSSALEQKLASTKKKLQACESQGPGNTISKTDCCAASEKYLKDLKECRGRLANTQSPPQSQELQLRRDVALLKRRLSDLEAKLQSVTAERDKCVRELEGISPRKP